MQYHLITLPFKWSPLRLLTILLVNVLVQRCVKIKDVVQRSEMVFDSTCPNITAAFNIRQDLCI